MKIIEILFFLPQRQRVDREWEYGFVSVCVPGFSRVTVLPRDCI